MGLRNVELALSTWGHLPKRAPQVLAWMARASKDGDSPPWYGKGWVDTARALGRKVPDPPVDDDPAADAIRRERAAAKRAVTAAVTELERAGAIRYVRRGQPGQRARYELLLTPPMVEHSAPPNGGTESSTVRAGVRHDPSPNRWSTVLPDGGALSSPMVEHSLPPEEDEEEEERGDRTQPEHRNHSAGARDFEAEVAARRPWESSGVAR